MSVGRGLILSVGLGLGLGACASSTPPVENPAQAAEDLRYNELAEDLIVEQLTDGVFRHISSKYVLDSGFVPSNGLLVVAPRGVILIDTPWTEEGAKILLAWARKTFRREVREVLVTHSHDDRLTGAKIFAAAGATIRALPRTIERARAKKWEVPATELPADATLDLLGQSVSVLFPGAAHAPDNLVVWLADKGVLFGGCMVRTAADEVLGNLADADVESWRPAIKQVIARFGSAKIVVPGHGDTGGAALLSHTLKLVERKLNAPPD